MRQLKNFKAEPEKVSAPGYEGMSESELKSELMKRVLASERDGTFSPEQLDDFVSFVSPSLDEGSRARLIELVGLIKGGGLF